MPRTTTLRNGHEFTRQIKSTVRAGTRFASMENHNEKKAKNEKFICCHDCRFFDNCKTYIGMYHKTCNEFEWW